MNINEILKESSELEEAPVNWLGMKKIGSKMGWVPGMKDYASRLKGDVKVGERANWLWDDFNEFLGRYRVKPNRVSVQFLNKFLNKHRFPIINNMNPDDLISPKDIQQILISKVNSRLDPERVSSTPRISSFRSQPGRIGGRVEAPPEYDDDHSDDKVSDVEPEINNEPATVPTPKPVHSIAARMGRRSHLDPNMFTQPSSKTKPTGYGKEMIDKLNAAQSSDTSSEPRIGKKKIKGTTSGNGDDGKNKSVGIHGRRASRSDKIKQYGNRGIYGKINSPIPDEQRPVKRKKGEETVGFTGKKGENGKNSTPMPTKPQSDKTKSGGSTSTRGLSPRDTVGRIGPNRTGGYPTGTIGVTRNKRAKKESFGLYDDAPGSTTDQNELTFTGYDLSNIFRNDLGVNLPPNVANNFMDASEELVRQELMATSNTDKTPVLRKTMKLNNIMKTMKTEGIEHTGSQIDEWGGILNNRISSEETNSWLLKIHQAVLTKDVITLATIIRGLARARRSKIDVSYITKSLIKLMANMKGSR